MRYMYIIVCISIIGMSVAYGQSSNSSGPVRLLISRPNSFEYTVNPKTVWIAAVIESFLYLRFDTIEKLKVISIDEMTPLIPSFRNLEKRVSLNKYKSTAEELNATHVLYSEYEICPGNKVKINFCVENVDKSKKSEKKQIQVSSDNLNESLTEAAMEIALMLGISKSDLPTASFHINILGAGEKNVMRLGNYLTVESEANKKTLSRSAENCEIITKETPDMYLAYYTGSRLYMLAGKKDKAAALIQSLVDRLGDSYPKLYLQLAASYRKTGKLDKAKNAVERAARNPNLRAVVLWEQGLIYEGMGKRAEALASFQNLSDIDKSDPNVYRQLAKINIALKKTNKAENYVEEAAKLSGKPVGKIYLEIGREFAKSKDNANAMGAYRKSTELTPDNEDAWSALIDIQIQQGLDSTAGVSCVSLFKLDYIKYEPYLEKAGSLFEQHGLIDMARQIYAVAFEKHSNPKFAILLAKLEFKQNDFNRVKKLLESLDASWHNDPEVAAMLDKCYEDKVPPIIILNGADPFIVEAGSGKYVDPGATAMDDVDGDQTHFIQASGKVNTSVIDTYMVTYTVSDASRNTATKKRTVIVLDNDNPPVLALIGPDEIELKLGDTFDDQGAMAMDTRDGDLSKKIQVSGTVNQNVAGEYTLTYSVKDNTGNTASKTRKVVILGDITPPVLTLTGSSPMYLKVGERYNEQGCKANDDIDGDLTKQRVITIKGKVNSMIPGPYKIIYTAKDRAGNISSIERVVNVLAKDTKTDKTPPVITLIGGTQKDIIYVGEEYMEPGINAIDDVDGDVTAFIKIEGDINPTLPGNYTIKYSASDKSGNRAEKSLYVKVRKKGEKYREERVASIKSDVMKKASTTNRDYETGQGLKNIGRKKGLIAFLTGVCGIGMGALGYYVDSKITGYYDEWKVKYREWKYEPDADDEAKLKEERDEIQNKIYRAERLRTLCYIGGGAFGVGFTVNIAIPKKLSKRE